MGKKSLHYLRYLASRHERNTLKLRFVLNPFVFVFLIAGQEQYHIVLETLDTEEATYVCNGMLTFLRYEVLNVAGISTWKELHR